MKRSKVAKRAGGLAAQMAKKPVKKPVHKCGYKGRCTVLRRELVELSKQLTEARESLQIAEQTRDTAKTAKMKFRDAVSEAVESLRRCVETNYW